MVRCSSVEDTPLKIHKLCGTIDVTFLISEVYVGVCDKEYDLIVCLWSGGLLFTIRAILPSAHCEHIGLFIIMGIYLFSCSTCMVVLLSSGYVLHAL